MAIASVLVVVVTVVLVMWLDGRSATSFSALVSGMAISFVLCPPAAIVAWFAAILALVGVVLPKVVIEEWRR